MGGNSIEVNHIKLNGLTVDEVVLQAEDSSFLIRPPQATGSITAQKPIAKKTANYEKLYHGERTLHVAAQKIPISLLGRLEGLEGIMVKDTGQPFERPQMFETFANAYLQRKPLPYDLEGLGLADYEFDGKGGLTLVVRRTLYSDFAWSNLAMDVHLSQFDPAFGEGETLRDYETQNGKMKHPRDSVMANRIGIGYMVLLNNMKELLLVKKGKGLAIAGGTICLPGSTPVWDDDTANAIRKDVAKELSDELTLAQSDYETGKAWFVRDLVNGQPAFFVTVNVNSKRSFEDIAAACLSSPEARKEHTRLYRMPLAGVQRTVEAINALGSLRRYNVHYSTPAAVGLLS